jgi:hypothetical protein
MGGKRARLFRDKMHIGPHMRMWFDSARMTHRLNGPAIESRNGMKQWYVHGVLHREDGPAIESTFQTTNTEAEGFNQRAWYRWGVLCQGLGPVGSNCAYVEIERSLYHPSKEE